MQLNTVDELISDIRQGRMVVLLDDDADSGDLDDDLLDDDDDDGDVSLDEIADMPDNDED